MADNNAEPGQSSFPINATTILAVLTLMGGVLFATHQLSSDRPVIKSGVGNGELSEQKIDTRLWEDPFGRIGEVRDLGSNAWKSNSLIGHLENEMGEEENTNFRIVAVMVPGGPSSEDRENRLRARFAVVSALAESAYAPRRQMQIGIGAMHWPNTADLASNLSQGSPREVALQPQKETMFYGFEWFNHELYHQHRDGRGMTTNALLLLWLDEDEFDDYPVPRLDLFLREALTNNLTEVLNTNAAEIAKSNLTVAWSQNLPNVLRSSLTDELKCKLAEVLTSESDPPEAVSSNLLEVLKNNLTEVLTNNLPYVVKTNLTNCLITDWKANAPTGTNHPIALIGPGQSDTLKAMFLDGFGQAVSNSSKWTNLTKRVSVFLATPQAIDEVLVTNHVVPWPPRMAVLDEMTNWFLSVSNFAATDSQLARSVFRELELRGVDLTKTNQYHLVLISGWDEFFGRMRAAAYAAQLAQWQQEAGTPHSSNTKPFDMEQYLNQYGSNCSAVPTNLHTFLYLSGLDGQGLQKEPSYETLREPDQAIFNPEDQSRVKRARFWTPDENRAEGPAQYDYLGRLAMQIENLNSDLLRKDQGRIAAIGVGGGDVYDTLLILQALRPRFPETVFFTTELDARFWDAKELQWTRNMFVVSPYGLALNDSFQGQTAPFRDSHQTAIFAATLAALGDTHLQQIAAPFPVRTFEVGRLGPVDLSDAETNAGPHLHPPLKQMDARRGPMVAAVLVLICVFVLSVILINKPHRFAVEYYQTLAKALWVQEEDIGGMDGFLKIASALKVREVESKAKKESFEERWLLDKIESAISKSQLDLDDDAEQSSKVRKSLLEAVLGDNANGEAAGNAAKESLKDPVFGESLRLVSREFLELLNETLAPNQKVSAGRGTRFIDGPKALDKFKEKRDDADKIIEALLRKPAGTAQPSETFDFRKAADAARTASKYLYHLGVKRTYSLFFLGILALVFGICLFNESVKATADWPWQISGASIWPSNWIYFISSILGLFFIVESYCGLQRTKLESTRKFRFDFYQRSETKNDHERPEMGWMITRSIKWLSIRFKEMFDMLSEDPVVVVDANEEWKDYQRRGEFSRRAFRSLFLSVLYSRVVRSPAENRLHGVIFPIPIGPVGGPNRPIDQSSGGSACSWPIGCAPL